MPSESDAIQRLSDILIESFPYNATHSWSRALNVPDRLFTTFIRKSVSEAVTQNLGVLASRTGSDLSGVLLLEDFFEPEEQDHEPEPTHFDGKAELFSVISTCNQAFWDDLARQLGTSSTAVAGARLPGAVAYFAWIGVRPGVRGRGVARALVEAGVAEAAGLGYQHALAFCTSPTSARVFTRAGFRVCREIPYGNFAMPDGRRPLASLPDSCFVMALRL
eukprot:CAMPEP_0113664924 /NCGR_PEP_ID=MMETSP0038_2-20120614/2012_1 /TAXON_ID=2898 /ORGANISM="Cryptomonas paramecium" /LENGTH=219 /DNA_ID=CAMNT_0000580205 /DNA_START=138 /DNA_END=793 /DNA_ORIENTATION=- /assembly_acc=CAM_ASM_000170